jgi:hypothetical protein
MRNLLYAIAALTAVLYTPGVAARNWGQYAQNNPALGDWFKAQRVPAPPGVTGGRCCDEADGSRATEDLRPDGHYWVKFVATIRPWVGSNYGDPIDVESDWMQVPDEAVIRDQHPNPVGAPVVWWYFSSGQGFTDLIKENLRIRCFKPGPET